MAPHSPEPDVLDFAEKLYQVSVYTAEELALRELISAETELVTSRWLAKRLSAQGGRLPAHGPANLEAMSQALGRVVAPIVKMHIRKRARALKAERLGERTAFVRECGRQVRLPQERPNILFMSGGSASGHGDQLEDIPEILAFHETPAAKKWRQLWPQLRAHAARLAALHYRIDADPGLGGSSKSWDERATLLARRIGGRVLTPADWQALTIGRLGFTLSRLDRFLLPLGTEMQQSDAADERSMTIAEQGSAIMITEQEGRGLALRFLDAGWERDIAHKLSPLELEQIDNALTATYSKTKDRWFAPLELEFEVYLSVSRQIRASTELRAVRQSFARQSDAAMNRAWASWQKRRPQARSSGRQGGHT